MTLDVDMCFNKQSGSFLSLEPSLLFFQCNLQAPSRVHARLHAFSEKRSRKTGMPPPQKNLRNILLAFFLSGETQL